MLTITPIASGSTGNAYLISDGDSRLLLECGIRMAALRKACKFSLTSLDGCLISHEHKDHSHAAKDIMKAGVEVYTSKGTAEALGLSGHRLNVISPKEQFSIGKWGILPFDVAHDAAEPMGFLVSNGKNKLLFVTDSHYVKYRFPGLTHIMLEVNYVKAILQNSVEKGYLNPELVKRILRNHMSLETAVEMLKANDLSRCREICLLHLSDNNSDADLIVREIQKATGIPARVF